MLKSAAIKVVAVAGLLISVSAPAHAQIDLSGVWTVKVYGEDWKERNPGPDPVDYTGLALSDEGRAKALGYTYSVLSLTERQCLYYAPHYVVFGPQGLRIWSDADSTTGQIVAWKISGAIDRDVVTIWMDGRPHPSDHAFHPFGGVTTGRWEGDTLTTYTTHVKAGYLRRNGVPSSDEATITMHITRHDDLLTVTVNIVDPVYLSEPHVVSRTWEFDPRAAVNATDNPCFSVTELPQQVETGLVPHILPGENPNLNDMARLYNLPMDAVLGHAETLYPEYRKKIRSTYLAPSSCTRY